MKSKWRFVLFFGSLFLAFIFFILFLYCPLMDSLKEEGGTEMYKASQVFFICFLICGFIAWHMRKYGWNWLKRFFKKLDF